MSSHRSWQQARNIEDLYDEHPDDNEPVKESPITQFERQQLLRFYPANVVEEVEALFSESLDGGSYDEWCAVCESIMEFEENYLATYHFGA